jgi:hypothetical protein
VGVPGILSLRFLTAVGPARGAVAASAIGRSVRCAGPPGSAGSSLLPLPCCACGGYVRG